jgi:hypothetical protein
MFPFSTLGWLGFCFTLGGFGRETKGVRGFHDRFVDSPYILSVAKAVRGWCAIRYTSVRSADDNPEPVKPGRASRTPSVRSIFLDFLESVSDYYRFQHRFV